MVRAGTAPKTPQWELAGREAEVDPSELGTYEGWCRAEQAEIDWNEPAGTVYNLIRGSNPQPGAWTTYEGSQLQVFDSRKIEGTTAGEAGTVTAIADDGFEVAAGDGIHQGHARKARGSRQGARRRVRRDGGTSPRISVLEAQEEAMSDFDSIIYEVADGRARITLNRPEKLNALSLKLQSELNEALWEADNNNDVHCVILRGAGRAFSAGYDLTGADGNIPVSRVQSSENSYRGGRSIDDDAWQLERSQR